MAQKIKLKAKESAAPGFPGFFGWLAATHPELYARAKAILPNAAAADGIGSSGNHLSGYPGHSMNGLGDDSAALQDLGMPDLSQLSQAGSFGITDSTPLPTTSFADTIANTVKALGTTILPLLSQQKILSVQLQRAQAGLKPLDTSGLVDPNSGLNVGLNTGTQKTFLMIAAIGGVALLAHSFLKSRR